MIFIPQCHTQQELGNIIKSSKVQHEWSLSFRSDTEIETHQIKLIHSKLKKKIILYHNCNLMYMGQVDDKFFFQWIIDNFNNKALIYYKHNQWCLQINNYDFHEQYQQFQPQ